MTALLALGGVSFLLYPMAGNWFSDRAHAAEIGGYIEQIASAPSAERERELDRAREYNQRLNRARLDDPYSSQETSNDERMTDYLSQLSMKDSGVMATIRIPAIGVALPVFHGTSDDVLTRGIGHLQGSALPVGGTGLNAVLTGHSGIPEADLFTALHDLEAGDQIYIDVAGTTFEYQVSSTHIVLPEETDLLQPVADQDLLTLVTCTPVGVNSHRLIARAHRVPDGDTVTDVLAVSGQADPGFPWWALGAGAAVVCAGLYVGWPRRLTKAPAPRAGGPSSQAGEAQ